MRRVTVVWLAFALGLAPACTASGASSGSDGHRSPTESAAVHDGRFSSDDLPRILLHADEAPKGTRSNASLAHASDVDSFARDVAERNALVHDGFESGYVVYFPPLSYFREEPHSVTDVSFQAIGGVFDDTAGASSSLHRFVDDLRARQMMGAADVSARGLGDEAFGLAGGAAVDGSFVRVYAWRVSNLILVLVASGPVGEHEALTLARTMDARAA